MWIQTQKFDWIPARAILVLGAARHEQLYLVQAQLAGLPKPINIALVEDQAEAKFIRDALAHHIANAGAGRSPSAPEGESHKILSVQYLREQYAEGAYIASDLGGMAVKNGKA